MVSSKAAAVAVTDLVQEFKMGDITVVALRSVSFEIDKGEFVCLFGPSGSGKSTLLNLIGGLDRFISGRIVVEGQDIGGLDERQLARYRREQVGFIFQSYNLIPTLTARQNVEIPLMFAGVGAALRREKAETALKAVGLERRQSHRPSELSGGEQQRVSVARALINTPSVVLADEPTGNLDTVTSKGILDLLKDTCRKMRQTFIVVSHDPEVAKYADKVLCLRDGELEKPRKRMVGERVS